MNNLMILNETSPYSSSEVKESVPRVVQTTSPDELRLFWFVLILMIAILALLAISFLIIKRRQDSLHKTLHTMTKLLERIEEKIPDSDNRHGTDYFSASSHKRIGNNETSDSKQKKTSTTEPPVKTPAVTDSPEAKDSDFTFEIPEFLLDASHTKTKQSESASKAVTTDASGTSNQAPAVPPERPHPLTGVKVNAASHYKPNDPACFDKVPTQDALFILYSDLTVRPNSKQFNIFNNASYYINHDFTKIFEFQDTDGYLINMRFPIKCLKIEKPATVYDSQNGYVLSEKGIIIAEER